MTGADQSRIMQDQISGAAMAMPADTNKAFKVSKTELYFYILIHTQKMIIRYTYHKGCSFKVFSVLVCKVYLIKKRKESSFSVHKNVAASDTLVHVQHASGPCHCHAENCQLRK